MDYYVGNGVYDFLSKCKEKENYFWTSENFWILVYGDSNYEPKVVTVASGNPLNIVITEAEMKAVKVARQLVEGTDIGVNFVRFDPCKPINQVAYWNPGMARIPIISSEELKNRFRQYGLEMNEMSAHKSINDKSSSPYHDWQRAHMGDSVIVADIDLIRYQGEEIREIIELKRSYIDIEKWEPYKQDYKNFILLSKLARRRKLDFFIVYNHRTKTPFFDDVSKLKIFAFDHRRQICCRFLGYRNIYQFAEGITKKER